MSALLLRFKVLDIQRKIRQGKGEWSIDELREGSKDKGKAKGKGRTMQRNRMKNRGEVDGEEQLTQAAVRNSSYIIRISRFAKAFCSPKS